MSSGVPSFVSNHKSLGINADPFLVTLVSKSLHHKIDTAPDYCRFYREIPHRKVGAILPEVI